MKEEEEKAVPDGSRKGRARGRKKVAAAPTLPEPDVPPVRAKRNRTSARRGRGEAGGPCDFWTKEVTKGRRVIRVLQSRARHPLTFCLLVSLPGAAAVV